MNDIEHLIRVDENIVVNIKIPREISILEFKALTMKVNKIFNISGTISDDSSFSNITKLVKSKRSTNTRREIFYDIVREKIINNNEYNVIVKIINQKYGTNYDNVQIAKMFNYLKEKRTDIIDYIRNSEKVI